MRSGGKAREDKQSTGGNAALETRSLALTGSLKPWHWADWKPQA